MFLCGNLGLLLNDNSLQLDKLQMYISEYLGFILGWDCSHGEGTQYQEYIIIEEGGECLTLNIIHTNTLCSNPPTVEPLLSGRSGTYYCPYLRNVRN